MGSGYEQELEESLARYRQRRQELADFQRGMAAIAVTVTAPRRVVTVTMGNAGEIREIKFPTAAYRSMTPAELATVVTRTIEDARSEALDRAAELLAAMLPPGVDARQLVRGKGDLTQMLPEDPLVANPAFGLSAAEA